MKALHYIAAETNFTAGTFIWLGKVQKRIRKSQLRGFTLFSIGTKQSVIYPPPKKKVLHIYTNGSRQNWNGCSI